jgi:hypothetical protein
MYRLLRPVLNKGGAGRSASRQDTIDALLPLVERHAVLLVTYDAALRTLSDRRLAEELEPGMNRLRTELGKLRETVLSSGGTPPNTIGLEARVTADSDRGILEAIEAAERDYRQALRDVLGYPHHQIRTQAILNNNLTGSEERLGRLRPLVDRAPTRRRVATSVPVDEVTTTPADLPHPVHQAGPDEQPYTERREHDAR